MMVFHSCFVFVSFPLLILQAGAFWATTTDISF